MRQFSYNILAKVGGVAVAGGICTLVGEVFDNMPIVKNAFPEFINQVTGINLEGHLDKLFGSMGAFYGLIKTKIYRGEVTIDDKTLIMTRVNLPPLEFTYHYPPLIKRFYRRR